ncbi:hypothetical protein [Streptomyces sp. NPDC097981]|uniref:hypothetical protein n=1 Tax=Streptomyces sp. NPDC097981 TaxID=3155428 RepID=UPI00332BC5F2
MGDLAFAQCLVRAAESGDPLPVRGDGVLVGLGWSGWLYQHVVAVGALYTLTMTSEVCEEPGLATVPRQLTPGLRPVMPTAGVDPKLITWTSTRRQQIEQALEGITDLRPRGPGSGRRRCRRPAPPGAHRVRDPPPRHRRTVDDHLLGRFTIDAPTALRTPSLG